MDPVLASAIFVLGLAFGSFLNVCIYRLPRDLSVVRPRSTCPRCEHLIRAYDNIPVLSWLILRGRCRNCKAYISPRYLVVELLTGAIFLATVTRTSAPPWQPSNTVPSDSCCSGLIFTDAETQLLPDKMTLPGLALGLGLSLVVPVNDLASQLLPGLVSLPVSSEVSWHLLSLVDAVLGAVVGASFIYGAGAIYLRARGVEGMGFGDVKLMAMVGAFLGAKLTIFTLFSASIAGSLFGVSTVLAVWIKRTRRRMKLNHESAGEPGVGPGYRRQLRCAAIKCRLAFFSAAWPWSPFLWQQLPQAGTGGCYETGDQSHRAAHGADIRGRELCFHRGPAVDETNSPEYQRRKFLFPSLHIFGIREFSPAYLSCGDPAIEAAEARTAKPASGGAAPRQDFGEHQRRRAFESLIGRTLLHSQRTGAASQCFGQADPGFRFARRNERG